MIHVAFPAALWGLLGLPLLWWAHARAGRPVTVPVASLAIWSRLDKARVASAEQSRRRRWIELLVEASALVALTLAAAGPQLRSPTPGGERLVIVLDNGPVMQTRLASGTAWDAAQAAAGEAIAALSPGAEVQLRPLVGTPGPWESLDDARRRLADVRVSETSSSAAPILRAALAERARVLYIARRPLLIDGVESIAVGPPASDNAGWVDLARSPTFWAAVWSATDREVELQTPAGPRTLRLRAGRRTTLELPGAQPRVELRLPADNLPSDDVLVAIRRAPLPVAISGTTGPIRDRLAAILGLLPEAVPAAPAVARLRIRLGEAVGPGLSIFPKADLIPLESPTYIARTAASPLLDGLDLSRVPIRRRCRPPDGLRPLAWSDTGDPLILDAVDRVVVAFDPVSWVDDPSFAIFVRRVIERTDPTAGRYALDRRLPGIGATDNRGGRSQQGRAPTETTPDRTLRRDFRPWLAILAAIFLLASAFVRGRTPGPLSSPRTKAPHRAK